MPVIVANQLRKTFGTLRVLDGVSASIEYGERVGLVGINGSGKTTLARVLAGIDTADEGTVAVARDCEVAYLPQTVTLAEEASARETVLAGLRRWSDAKARYDRACSDVARPGADLEAAIKEQADAASEVERLGGWDRMHMADAILGHIGLTNLGAPVGTLSGGDRRRVALARILVAEPDLAILDEPSNHLDVETVAWLERFLVEHYRGALLLITHDRYLLDRVVTRTWEVEHGNLHSYPGGYESYLEAKAERLELQARTEANRQNLLRTELEWLRRQPKARTGKQKARIQRIEQAATQAPPKVERTTKLAMDTMRSGKTILELHDLGLQMDGRTLAKGLDLVMNPSDRLGVIGPNGIGKTTLLRCIVGELAPAMGKVVVGKNTQIAYFDQHRSGLDLGATVFDNVAGPRSKITLGGKDMDVHAYLERFLFSRAAMYQPVEGLSGGEKARVALAKMLSRGANLLLLDEPTNDLDIATLGALEQWLLEFGGAVIVVTHDRWFLNRVATGILAFDRQQTVRSYAGNYDDYVQQRQEQEPTAAHETPPGDRAKDARTAAARSKAGAPSKTTRLTYAERLELEALPERIEQAEQLVAQLQQELSDPRVYSAGGQQAKQLQQRLGHAEADAQALMTRWEQLESKAMK